MLKLLLLVLVIAVLAWMLGTRRRGGPPAAGPGGKRPPPGATPMLACAHCGVHLPQSEALSDGAGLPYCSQAHRAAGPP